MSEATEKLSDDGGALAHGLCAEQYAAVREGGAGLLELSARGRVEVSGGEAIQFLNGLITNDVKTLGAGAWMRAAFPNPQGRLLASVRVMRLEDNFLFDTEPETREAMFKTLARFTLAGDFRVRDLSAETDMLSVQGARAGEVLEAVLGREAASAVRGRVASARFADASVTLLRATHTAEDGFDLIAPVGVAEALREALIAAGARVVGREAQEVLRVEAGVPRYGVDMDETNVVSEVVNEDALSFTKGCYVGQEIIARIHWRGHVAKKLTGLVLDESLDETRAAMLSGAKLSAEGEERDAGRLTSCVYSPRLKRLVALGIVKYDYLAPATRVRVVATDAEVYAAQVAELPHVRGSWFAGAE
ncbi:MAG TPA: glycine cleavage T C-terminal barrel domain-containing protein [Pyrinomonadaceae bacterium]|nr:glycine cleavage T C-terminal barrel domain-containing protein [Pyrinomonadaceae bacterium]